MILTGINSDGARTLARLGIDFSRITIKGSLRSGIAEAPRVKNMLKSS